MRADRRATLHGKVVGAIAAAARNSGDMLAGQVSLAARVAVGGALWSVLSTVEQCRFGVEPRWLRWCQSAMGLASQVAARLREYGPQYR